MAHYFCNWQCWDIELQQGKAHFSNCVRKWKKQEAAPKCKWIPLNVNRLIQNNLLSLIFHLCSLLSQCRWVCAFLCVDLCRCWVGSATVNPCSRRTQRMQVPYLRRNSFRESMSNFSLPSRYTHTHIFLNRFCRGQLRKAAVCCNMKINIKYCLHHYLQLGNYFVLISNISFI